MNQPFEFRIGDKVKYSLRSDEVFELTGNGMDLDYPLRIDFGVTEGKRTESFTSRGFLLQGHIKPVLEFIERPGPKLKTTKTVVQYANVYPGGVVEEVYDTLQEADNYGTVRRIAVVELKGTYETEE